MLCLTLSCASPQPKHYFLIVSVIRTQQHLCYVCFWLLEHNLGIYDVALAVNGQTRLNHGSQVE